MAFTHGLRVFLICIVCAVSLCGGSEIDESSQRPSDGEIPLSRKDVQNLFAGHVTFDSLPWGTSTDNRIDVLLWGLDDDHFDGIELKLKFRKRDQERNREIHDLMSRFLDALCPSGSRKTEKRIVHEIKTKEYRKKPVTFTQPCSKSPDLSVTIEEEYGHTVVTISMEVPVVRKEKKTIKEPALIVAAREGDLDKVKAILASGTAVDLRSDIREAPIFGLKKGRNTALHVAASNGRIDVVKYLLDKGADPDAENVNGKTPLMCAVEHPEIIKILLEAGADVNARDHDRNTALHSAAWKDAGPSATLLLKYAADPDAADDRGMTPMMVAAMTATADVIRILLDQGADPERQDKKGMTAADHARKMLFGWYTVTRTREFRDTFRALGIEDELESEVPEHGLDNQR